jgi:protein-L-isoaspartate(D-aspartate) O-methyltransferase
MLDSIKHKALRERLIVSLAEKGITDESVLTAMQKVPRHLFMESVLEHAAYEDRALPIAEGQTISQPFTVAYQTQLMGIKPKMKVLEIGTGSG